jgi:hypothetical protein
MGGEQTRKGKHVSFFLTCCVIIYFGLGGCTGRWAPFQHQKGPSKAENFFGTHEGALAKARVLLDHGEYEAARKEADSILKTDYGRSGDGALFLIALIYAHPKNPDTNWQKSQQYFQRLKKEFPSSLVTERAELIALLVAQLDEKDKKIRVLNKKKAQLLQSIASEKAQREGIQEEAKKLQAEAENLKDQLEKLKEIDLGMEEKKNEAK